jgi:hypothetical protein
MSGSQAAVIDMAGTARRLYNSWFAKSAGVAAEPNGVLSWEHREPGLVQELGHKRGHVVESMKKEALTNSSTAQQVPTAIDEWNIGLMGWD